jgi:hypothetical protein
MLGAWGGVGCRQTARGVAPSLGHADVLQQSRGLLRLLVGVRRRQSRAVVGHELAGVCVRSLRVRGRAAAFPIAGEVLCGPLSGVAAVFA